MISRDAGSPAWAGIDPLHHTPKCFGRWFPRVGGDRPLKPGVGNNSLLVPPRGRG